VPHRTSPPRSRWTASPNRWARDRAAAAVRWARLTIASDRTQPADDRLLAIEEPATSRSSVQSIGHCEAQECVLRIGPVKRPCDPDDDLPELIEPGVSRVEVAAHLARCEGCRTLLEGARRGPPSAMEVWRREFARCFARTRS